jgi:hypothetical protein
MALIWDFLKQFHPPPRAGFAFRVGRLYLFTTLMMGSLVTRIANGKTHRQR